MADLRALIASTYLARRSPLYRWMWTHYAELVPVLSTKGARWTAVAHTAAKTLGGPTPTRQTIRQTWQRVCRDRAKLDASAPASPPHAPDTLPSHQRTGEPDDTGDNFAFTPLTRK